METRKYDYYQLAKEFGVNNYENYREAFGAFQKAEGNTTLYGVDWQGEFHCIISK